MSELDLSKVLTLLNKAEEDWRVANVLMIHDNSPGSVGFHLQQCAEKLIKTLALLAGIRFSYTHDLNKLLKSILPRYPALEQYLNTLPDYTVFAAELRYDQPIGFEIAEIVPVLAEVGRFRQAALALLPPELRPQ